MNHEVKSVKQGNKKRWCCTTHLQEANPNLKQTCWNPECTESEEHKKTGFGCPKIYLTDPNWVINVPIFKDKE